MIFITTKYTGLIVPTVRGKRALRAETKKMYFHLLGYWHRFLRPKRFTNAGARELDYKPRSGEPGNPGRLGFKRSYTGRKLRTKGHTRPLVWSGDSETLSRIRDFRGARKGARAVLHCRGLNRRNRHSEINMRDEVTRISIDEKYKLWKLGEQFLDRALHAQGIVEVRWATRR